MSDAPALQKAADRPAAWQIASRVAAGLLGGYGFVWGFVAFGTALLVSWGMPFDEARSLAYLLAFVVYLVLFCWAFAAASVARVWAVLAGGAVLMTGTAWLLQRALV